MRFQDQIKEVIIRLFYLSFCFLFVFFIFYSQKHKALKIIINQISSPIDLQITNIFEAFFIQIQFCFFSSIFFFSPFLFFHIWQFLCPALYCFERKLFSHLCFSLSFLTLISSLFTFFYFPSVIFNISEFLSWPNNPPFLIQISLTDFIKTLYLFQICFIIYSLGILTIYYFFNKLTFDISKIRSWVFLIFIFVAATLTPSDFLCQFILTFLFQIHYEIFVLYSYILKRIEAIKKLKKEIPLLEVN